MSDSEDTVLKSEHIRRMKVKTEKLHEAEARLAELTDQLASAPDVGAMTAKLEALQAKFADLTDTHETFRGEVSTRELLYQAGITDAEDMDLVRYRYGRLSSDDRPELGAYLAEGARSDRYLGHLFSGDAAPAQASEGTPDSEPTDQAPRRVTARANAGVEPAASLAPHLTYEMVAAMSTADRLSPENRERIAEFFAADSP